MANTASLDLGGPNDFGEITDAVRRLIADLNVQLRTVFAGIPAAITNSLNGLTSITLNVPAVTLAMASALPVQGGAESEPAKPAGGDQRKNTLLDEAFGMTPNVTPARSNPPETPSPVSLPVINVSMSPTFAQDLANTLSTSLGALLAPLIGSGTPKTPAPAAKTPLWGTPAPAAKTPLWRTPAPAAKTPPGKTPPPLPGNQPSSLAADIADALKSILPMILASSGTPALPPADPAAEQAERTKEEVRQVNERERHFTPASILSQGMPEQAKRMLRDLSAAFRPLSDSLRNMGRLFAPQAVDQQGLGGMMAKAVPGGQAIQQALSSLTTPIFRGVIQGGSVSPGGATPTPPGLPPALGSPPVPPPSPGHTSLALPAPKVPPTQVPIPKGSPVPPVPPPGGGAAVAGVAALATNPVAWIVGLGAAAVATTAALAALPLAVHGLGKSLLDSQKYLADFSPRMAGVFVKDEIEGARRNMQMGGATADTAGGLQEALSQLADATIEIRALFTNLMNSTMTVIVKTITEMAKVFDQISEYMAERLGFERAKDQVPDESMGRWLMEIANDAQKRRAGGGFAGGLPVFRPALGDDHVLRRRPFGAGAP